MRAASPALIFFGTCGESFSIANQPQKGDERMLTVGDRFPTFRLTAVTSLAPGREFEEVTDTSHPGKVARRTSTGL